MKFKESDKILQVSAVPNVVCYTAYTKGPSVGVITKITPMMYRIQFGDESHDVRIEDIDKDFVH